MQAPACPRLDWRVRELEAAWPGLAVNVLASVGSTNTQLVEACRAGAAPMRHPTLLVAEQQLAGRGRQGRVWTSVPGASLTCSLGWPLQRADFSGLSLAVGVALADALDVRPGGAPSIGLKWPNDLWLVSAPRSGPARPAPRGGSSKVAEPHLLEDPDGAGRKLGGILIETTSQADGARIAVIGIGLNVSPLAVPDAHSGVACLHEIDAALDAPGVLHRIASPLLRALAEFERAGFPAFEARYRARDLLAGRVIEVGGRSGVAAGVAADGALLLRADEQVHRIVSGDVSVRLHAQGSPASTPC